MVVVRSTWSSYVQHGRRTFNMVVVRLLHRRTFNDVATSIKRNVLLHSLVDAQTLVQILFLPSTSKSLRHSTFGSTSIFDLWRG